MRQALFPGGPPNAGLPSTTLRVSTLRVPPITIDPNIRSNRESNICIYTPSRWWGWHVVDCAMESCISMHHFCVGLITIVRCGRCNLRWATAEPQRCPAKGWAFAKQRFVYAALFTSKWFSTREYGWLPLNTKSTDFRETFHFELRMLYHHNYTCWLGFEPISCFLFFPPFLFLISSFSFFFPFSIFLRIFFFFPFVSFLI